MNCAGVTDHSSLRNFYKLAFLGFCYILNNQVILNATVSNHRGFRSPQIHSGSLSCSISWCKLEILDAGGFRGTGGGSFQIAKIALHHSGARLLEGGGGGRSMCGDDSRASTLRDLKAGGAISEDSGGCHGSRK